ncbi:hypothetical protein F5B19DRAFT_440751 [Rostrohypoxylon terebratum]|nr:hypothetical protein F5B19DRAFT_440751 [Rostrohypoxylon terebratum]
MTANFSSSGFTFFVFTIIFTILCGIFVLLRFVAVRISGRTFYPDDGFILFAYLNMVALGGVGIWASMNGIGKSVFELSPYEIAVNAKLIMASNVCWLLGSVFVKLSILWLYHRLFATKEFRRWSWPMIGIVICYGIAFLIVFLTNCIPPDQLWNPQPGGHCRDMQYSDYATVGINLFLDLAILILPMPTLWGLQLPVRKKIMVTVMFSFGFATIVVMLYRIIITIQVRGDPDFTKHLDLIGLVSGFEVWFGIIIACLPTLAPLVRLSSDKFKTGSSGSRPSGYSKTSIPLKMFSNKSHTTGKYDQISSASQAGLNSHYEDAQHLVSHTGPGITTEVTYDPRNQRRPHPTDPSKIYVRSDIESRV